MPTLKFNPSATSILIEVQIKAAGLATIATMVVDTGASRIMIPWKLATAIGLPIDLEKTTQIVTATTIENAPEVVIPEISFLGKTVKNVKAIIKDLPPTSPAEGLLGLSFLKHFKLTLDFKKGQLSLE